MEMNKAMAVGVFSLCISMMKSGLWRLYELTICGALLLVLCILCVLAKVWSRGSDGGIGSMEISLGC